MSGGLTQENREQPTVEQIARHTGLSPKKVQFVLESSRPLLSLETPIGDDSALADLLPDPSTGSPEVPIVGEAMAAEVHKAAAAACGSRHPVGPWCPAAAAGRGVGGRLRLDRVGARC